MATDTSNPPPLSVRIDPLKYLGNLPEFSGDYRDLQTFINLIDRVHPILRAYDEPSQYLFSDIIKGRLRGKAREIVEINCQAESWNDVKQILINNFGDRHSLEELFDKLKSVTFRSNSVEFYNEIKTGLRSLNNKTITLLGSGPATSECARNNMKTALGIFREKLPEPMKTIITCRNPDSLETAMDILFQSGYAYTTQANGIFNSNTRQPNRSNNSYQTQYKGQENKTDKRQPQNNNRQQQINSYQNNRYNQGNNSYKPVQNQGNQYNKSFQGNSFQQRDNNYQPNKYNGNPPKQHNNQYYPQQNIRNPNYYQRNNLPPAEPMDINMVQNNDQINVNNQYTYGNNWEEQITKQEQIEYQGPPSNYQPADNPARNNIESSQNFLTVASGENYPI
ncbi:uncharacterized protein DDB_G0287625 [Stomoxys calcitrans]|uniref:uncharacterized protein DDB_G0287625 n=1 Tax=Stomoxys calcitrans TaxID=35570 RepID=UPI0027E22BCB|nr:uncharacterized protein DDB_G0287625 [Stomoxys calcitrans]